MSPRRGQAPGFVSLPVFPTPRAVPLPPRRFQGEKFFERMNGYLWLRSWARRVFYLSLFPGRNLGGVWGRAVDICCPWAWSQAGANLCSDSSAPRLTSCRQPDQNLFLGCEPWLELSSGRQTDRRSRTDRHLTGSGS